MTHPLSAISRGAPFVLMTVSLSAATIVVDPTGFGDFREIQPALDAAADGDTVLVKPGEYVITQSIDFNRLFVPGESQGLPKRLTLKSEVGAYSTTIKMTGPKNYTGSVVVFAKGEVDCRLEGFTLEGGQGTEVEDGSLGGGGIACINGSSARAVGCTITGNAAQHGGGAYCGGLSSLGFEDCAIAGNSAERSGGGVHCSSVTGSVDAEGQVTLDGCTISGNWSKKGGGICCDGIARLDVNDCWIEGNFAKQGGGIQCMTDGGCALTDCSIYGNRGKRGGGVSCGDYTAPVLTNCDLAGNRAKKGGGIYCGKGSTPTIVNCTVAGNTPKKLGGVGCHKKSKAVLKNTIVRDPTNVQKYATVSFSIVELDPQFIKVGTFDFKRTVKVTIDGHNRKMPDYIVEDPDHHLQPGSAAIDTGTPDGAPSTDREGYGRPCGEGYDIGAYEFGGCIVSKDPFWRGDVDGNGVVDITDPIYLLLFLHMGGAAPLCLDAADVDDSGALETTDAIYGLNYLFLGGPQLYPPFPDCGLDVKLDPLDCKIPPVCP